MYRSKKRVDIRCTWVFFPFRLLLNDWGQLYLKLKTIPLFGPLVSRVHITYSVPGNILHALKADRNVPLLIWLVVEITNYFRQHDKENLHFLSPGWIDVRVESKPFIYPTKKSHTRSHTIMQYICAWGKPYNHRYLLKLCSYIRVKLFQ